MRVRASKDSAERKGESTSLHLRRKTLLGNILLMIQPAYSSGGEKGIHRLSLRLPRATLWRLARQAKAL